RPTEDHSFRLSFSRAYRNPVPYQNFAHTNLNLAPIPGEPPVLVPGPDGTPVPATVTVLVLGNKNLDAERMKSYEAGYQGRFVGDRVRAHLDFFYAEYANLIGQVRSPTPDPLHLLQFSENVGGGDNIGFETGIEGFLAPWGTAFANYSFQQRHGKLMF